MTIWPVDWKKFVFDHAGANPGITGAKLFKLVEEKGRTLDPPESPHPRTIDRYLNEYKTKLEPARRRDYELVRWPDSFLDVLPWDAAPVCLEAVGTLQRRPNVRFVRWLHHVTQSVPGAHRDVRIVLADYLSGHEAAGTLTDVTGAVEAAMVRFYATGAIDTTSLPPPQFGSVAEIRDAMPGVYVDPAFLQQEESDDGTQS